MLHEMEKDPEMPDIKFKVTGVEDGNYGSLVNGIWNGMIKKLRDDVRSTCHIMSLRSKKLLQVVVYIRKH